MSIFICIANCRRQNNEIVIHPIKSSFLKMCINEIIIHGMKNINLMMSNHRGESGFNSHEANGPMISTKSTVVA